VLHSRVSQPSDILIAVTDGLKGISESFVNAQGNFVISWTF